MILTDCHTHAPDEEDSVIRICNVTPSDPEGPLPVHFSAGIHPKSIDPSETEKDLLHLASLLDSPGAAAVGECGMDSFSSAPMNLQCRIFLRQIRMAEERGLPVILHGVRCWPEIIRIRKEESDGTNLWVAHGFRSSREQALNLLDHGIIPSFGPWLEKDLRRQEVLASLPDDGFLLETDESPETPEAVAELASRIRECSMERLTEQVFNTFRRVFRKL